MSCQFYCPRHYGLTMNAVNDFVQQRSFVDVKLVCKNKKTLYSHKLILASASPFLKSVIEEMNSYDDMATLFLPDFDYNIVTLLLTFLCEGMMKLTWEELAEFRELCNGLGMNFPGADVVKVAKESHYAQAADITAEPITDAERRFSEESSSLVSASDALHTSAEVPATPNTYNTEAPLVPKIEDCEECQNFQGTEPDPGNAFQMLVGNITQQSPTDVGFSQPEKHRQMSLEPGESVTYSDAACNAESWRKGKYSHDGGPTDLNLWHGASSSTQELSQSNEASHMDSIPLMSRPVEEINFDIGNTHFVNQKSATQQTMQQLKAATKNPHSENDMNSIVLISRSADQSTYQQMKKQPKGKTKKLQNGAGVQKNHLTQLSNSSSVHKKLQEQIVSISHKMKQSPLLNSRSKLSDSKVGSKTQTVDKSVYPKKRKKSDGSER